MTLLLEFKFMAAEYRNGKQLIAKIHGYKIKSEKRRKKQQHQQSQSNKFQTYKIERRTKEMNKCRSMTICVSLYVNSDK